MTHLLQDLVIDRALRRATSASRPSTEFRGLLGRAEGKVADAEFATKTTTTFVKDKDLGIWETDMRTGDYVWRMVYDNTGAKQHQPPGGDRRRADQRPRGPLIADVIGWRRWATSTSVRSTHSPSTATAR